MKNNDIKINFGCSMNSANGWINIDNSLRHIFTNKIPFLSLILFKMGFLSKPFYEAHKLGKFKLVKYGDIRKNLKFKNNTIKCIYSSHVVEHLYPSEALSFLKECFRILEKKGVLRIVVPDLKKGTQNYLKGLNKNKTGETANNFSSLIYATDNKKGTKNGHHWMYDQYNLQEALRSAGFSNIYKCKSMDGKCLDLSNVEIRRKNNLIIEAIK